MSLCVSVKLTALGAADGGSHTVFVCWWLAYVAWSPQGSPTSQNVLSVGGVVPTVPADHVCFFSPCRWALELLPPFDCWDACRREHRCADVCVGLLSVPSGVYQEVELLSCAVTVGLTF